MEIEPLSRIDYREESIAGMTNHHLVAATKQLHFFRYKSVDQQKTYQNLLKELNRRQNSGII